MASLLHLSALAFFPALMALSASMDLLTFTIPNRLCVALALGYVVFAALLGVPAVDILLNVSCALAILAMTFVMFSLGWLGGGDAKLAAATALWFGFAHLLDYLFYASILGGVLTVALIQFRMLPLPQLLVRYEWIERLHRRGGGVPYGIALAAAALVVYPHTEWMAALGF